MKETYTLAVPAALEAVRESVDRLLAWLRLQGHSAATVKRWKLPLTEAITNGVRHGCRGREGAVVTVAARVGLSGTEVSVRDPGCFAPGPEFGGLPEDPLAESGRGGFLIAQGTDSFEHGNGPDGHVLILRWKETPALLPRLVSAAQNEEALDQLAAQLGDSYETVTAYADFAGWLATTGDFAELLARVRERLVRAVAHEHLVLRFIDDGQLVLGAPADGFPPAIALADPGLETTVAKTRSCVALGSPAEIPAGDPVAVAAGPVVIVAVGCPQRQRGTLTLIRAAQAQPFTAGNIAFAQAVANFLGTARATAELWAQRARQIKFEQELQLAAQIQNSLLPQSPPALAAWAVSGGCRQSRTIGGDYFDWKRRDDGSCLVLVADVMGKGMPAAMVATMLRSTWRTLAAYGSGPGRLLTELNLRLQDDLAALEVFITAVLIHLPAMGGRVTYASAGHCALLHHSAGAIVPRPHPAGGPPLGIEPGVPYAEAELGLRRDDWLFAYTDGCYERGPNRGAQAGVELLTGELRTAVSATSAGVVERVLDRLEQHTSGEAPDDCTLVAIRFLP